MWLASHHPSRPLSSFCRLLVGGSDDSSKHQPYHSRSFFIRATSLVLVSAVLLLLRLRLLYGHMPHFSAQDNPASFSDSLLTRALTYNYLYFFNSQLLMAPAILCYDWQMGSIPLVESIADPRNIGTGLLYVCLIGLLWTAYKDHQPVSGTWEEIMHELCRWRGQACVCFCACVMVWCDGKCMWGGELMV